MIFKELINNVNYDDVWLVLDKECKHEDGAYEAYKSVLEELKILEPKPSEPPILMPKMKRFIKCYLADKF